jgi:hypothetical protein
MASLTDYDGPCVTPDTRDLSVSPGARSDGAARRGCPQLVLWWLTLLLKEMVRDRGFEPLTPSVSRKCSATELTALRRNQRPKPLHWAPLVRTIAEKRVGLKPDFRGGFRFQTRLQDVIAIGAFLERWFSRDNQPYQDPGRLSRCPRLSALRQGDSGCCRPTCGINARRAVHLLLHRLSESVGSFASQGFLDGLMSCDVVSVRALPLVRLGCACGRASERFTLSQASWRDSVMHGGKCSSLSWRCR